MNYENEEFNDYIVPEDEAPIKEEPKKKSKGVAIGFTIPTIILTCINAFLSVGLWAMTDTMRTDWDGPQALALIIVAVIFGALLIICGVLSILQTIFSIVLLCNNSKKKLPIWYPILLLVIAILFIASTLLSVVFISVPR